MDQMNDVENENGMTFKNVQPINQKGTDLRGQGHRRGCQRGIGSHRTWKRREKGSSPSLELERGISESRNGKEEVGERGRLRRERGRGRGRSKERGLSWSLDRRREHSETRNSTEEKWRDGGRERARRGRGGERGKGRGERGRGRGLGGRQGVPPFDQLGFTVDDKNLWRGSQRHFSFSEDNSQRMQGRGRKNQGSHSSRKQVPNKIFNPADPISFETLQSLYEQDENELLLTISSDTSIKAVLIKTSLPEDMVILMLKVLSKASRALHAPQTLLKLFQTLIQTNFLLVPLVHFLTCLTVEKLPKRESLDACFNVIHLCDKLLTLLPSSSLETVTVLIGMLQRVAEDNTLQLQFKEPLEKLETFKNCVVQQVQGGELMKDQEIKTGNDSEDPPDDFRQISVTPKSADVTEKAKPFLRKNIVYGSYHTVNHYLDVQFRLLREDFISPLREGIQELRRNEKQGILKKRLQDIRIYDGVHIEDPICTKIGLIHALKFDTRHLQQVRWERSSRLMNGSLLCISKDDFKTVFFATVAERDVKKLGKGLIYVKLEANSIPIGPFDEFRMAESSAYFEAYRHNLEGLQEILEESLPFKRYILNNEPGEINSPRYLRGRGVTYNFHCILPKKLLKPAKEHTKSSYQAFLQKVKEVPVLSCQNWPEAKLLGLDDSQFNALQTALTKEFCVIQGPPGTGKTYIGLKIVQILLANQQVWNADHKPILIVCYTNHALDQFLEGIIAFNGNDGICRIGGGVKTENEKLLGCQISSWRRKPEFKARISSRIKDSVSDVKVQLEDLEKQINQVSSTAREIRSGILMENDLQHLMTESQRESFMSRQQKRKDAFVEWLIFNEVTVQATTDQKEDDAKKQENEDEDEAEDGDIENVQQEMQKREVDLNEPESVSEKHDQILSRKKEPTTQFALRPEEIDDKEDEGGWQQRHKKQKQKLNRKQLQNKLNSNEVMCMEEAFGVTDVWALTHKERWKLYRFWVSSCCNEIIMRIQYLKDTYAQMTKELKELQMQEDYQLIRESRIVGLTTTGAAKQRQLLQRIQPRIIIVEEAAEVFESHVITTMSKACEHLILIGDHQQLRPNPTVYKLAKDYHMDISLFERMVKNGMKCDRLGIQHRMRPEISKLIVPHVYSDLTDHESVHKYENVKGIRGNLYFIRHDIHEALVEDTRSRSNIHEAKFLTALCRYFLQQGYEPNQITVLTTYTGQLFQIMKLMPKDEFQGVRITPVDRYQGEENDIILLSLVRSNEEGRIGFLSISNRVCVALSRAKIGFFAIGNMKLLAKSSNLWKGIIDDLEKEGKLVEALPLACQNHPSTMIEAKSEEDFKKAPDGGCMEPCEYRLMCGHVCTLKCHPYDPNHEKFLCQKPCIKILCNNNHICPKLCYEDCGNCMQPVEKTVPKCGHLQTMACSKEPSTFTCKVPCNEILPCGHQCTRSCGENCVEKCRVMVEGREWPCGHNLTTYCFNNPSNYLCNVEIAHSLPCGHSVALPCSNDLDSYNCTEKVSKKLECGHSIDVVCFKKDEPMKCNFNITIMCPCNKTHKFTHPCGDKENAVCPLQCKMPLPCSHLCLGKCGDCQGSQHQLCQVYSSRSHMCGHVGREVCGQPCAPCSFQCDTYCGHSRCNKRCGEICINCSYRCGWQCPHFQCTRLCTEMCNRPACNMPCFKMLWCGHMCPGLCGEPCPPCSICYQQNFQQVVHFLKIQLNQRSRFLILRPCGHVVEVTYMDACIDRQNGAFPRELKFYECPISKCRISFCPRYGNYIKRRNKEMNAAKEAIIDQFVPPFMLGFKYGKYKNFELFQQRYQTVVFQNPSEKNRLALGCINIIQGMLQLNTGEQIKPEFMAALQMFEEYLSDVHPNCHSEEDRLITGYATSKVLYMLAYILKIKHSISTNDKGLRKYQWLMERKLNEVQDIYNNLNEILVFVCYGLVDKKKTIKNVNKHIKLASRSLVSKFRPYQRNYIDDFLKHINKMVPKLEGMMVNKKWLICHQGHIYCVDAGSTSVACPSCDRRPQEEQLHEVESSASEESDHEFSDYYN